MECANYDPLSNVDHCDSVASRCLQVDGGSCSLGEDCVSGKCDSGACKSTDGQGGGGTCTLSFYILPSSFTNNQPNISTSN